GSVRAASLVNQGIPPGCEVVTSADAVCSLVQPGESALVIGGPGLCDALTEHGAQPTPAAEADPAPLVSLASARAGASPISDADPTGMSPGTGFDVVVVGLSRGFDYRQLDAAAAAVRAGARLLATNDDATFPGADGIHPGAGSVLAAVEAASQETALVAGKPLAPMCELIVARLGLGERGSAQDRRGDVVVVGDRPETDGKLAENLGVRFALVLSGVTGRDDLPVDEATAFLAEDLAELVANGVT
ncbi:MAG: HAD-IIA family hydrolase, partial [Microthrixaceae bacterium]